MRDHKRFRLRYAAADAAAMILLAGCGVQANDGTTGAQSPTEGAPTGTASPTEANTGSASAEKEPVVIESGGEVPFYARFGENETFDNGEWTVIVFYRPSECIPGDFNLSRFFHFPGENSPGAFACAPPTTTSVETWQNGPETDPAPLISEMTGRGAVPVWFIKNAEVEKTAADGVMTIDELRELPSRLVGSADTFSELLHPTQSNARPLIRINARGALEDGREFEVSVSKGAPDMDDHVTINMTG